MIQFDGIAFFVQHITHIVVGIEDESTIIYLASGERERVNVPYKEVQKRLYRHITGATHR